MRRRGVLKVLLRTCVLKAVSIEQLPPDRPAVANEE
jgi:hypothetical protein